MNELMVLRRENQNLVKVVADIKIKNDQLSNNNELLNSKIQEKEINFSKSGLKRDESGIKKEELGIKREE